MIVEGEIVAPSTPRESSIVTSAMKEPRKRGVMIIKIHGDLCMPGGTPDLIGCVSGRCFVLEVKRLGQLDATTRRYAFEGGPSRQRFVDKVVQYTYTMCQINT